MSLIKRIILWIINFFKKLFGIKNKKYYKIADNSTEKHNKKNISAKLPSYMMISEGDKQILVDSINDIKKKLNNNSIKKREIAKILSLISSVGININSIDEYLNKQDFDKLNAKKVDTLLGDCDITIKEKVYKIIDDYKNNNSFIKETIHNLDVVREYIKNNDISMQTSGLINNELLNISFNDKIIDNNTILFDKDILNNIINWDKSILDEVKLEYEKVNYVTISTVMIDRMITRYEKIEENYKQHRFNKSYYEKELGKIKEQLDFLKKIKNTSIVYKEIENLRKELYTKSKDKYDILYNNEIFMNINKKCDGLLDRVNQKVIDIKKDENKKDDKKESIKEEYLKKILLRFQDLNLSRNLILIHKEKESEISDYSNVYLYLEEVYLEFVEGVSDDFNYQRNRVKTELVKLYNDLNNIISYKKKEKHVSIDHINFKMEDLVDAVKIKKSEIENSIDNISKVNSRVLVDEKLLQIEKKFIENNNEKVLKKTN